MKTEEINVSLTHQSIEKSFPVEPENIYAVEVIISFIIYFQNRHYFDKSYLYIQ